MPQPIEATEPADRLAVIWQRASARLQLELESVSDEIGRLAASKRRTRLLLRRRRVAALLGAVARELELLQDETRAWIVAELVKIYEAGAVAGIGAQFAWTVPHSEAVQVLANQIWGDALAASKFVEADVRLALTQAADEAVEAAITSGRTARASATKAAREVLSRGVGTVRYADGSARKIGDYMEMAVRTRSAIAYNLGTVNGLKSVGAGYAKILDGDGCGLRGHNDPQRANGMIVSLDFAAANPISHPNCVRSYSYLFPDELAAADPSDLEELDDDEGLEDAAVAFDAALARQTESAGRRTSYRRR